MVTDISYRPFGNGTLLQPRVTVGRIFSFKLLSQRLAMTSQGNGERGGGARQGHPPPLLHVPRAFALIVSISFKSHSFPRMAPNIVREMPAYFAVPGRPRPPSFISLPHPLALPGSEQWDISPFSLPPLPPPPPRSAVWCRLSPACLPMPDESRDGVRASSARPPPPSAPHFFFCSLHRQRGGLVR